jgi:hypothetical protein
MRGVAEQRVEADEAGASDGASPLNPVSRTLEALHQVSEIPSDIVEAAWQETARFSDARGRSEMERLGREQPELLAYVLGATEELSAPVHALGVYT